MPSSDPSDIPRPLFSRRPELAPAPAEHPAERASFHPQYVSVHALREHGHGPRNLAWGVVTLVLALALSSAALFVVGAKALLALAACLLTFTALFVLARMHVFRQRNGGFLALGIVCFFGAAMPLIELGFGALDAFIKSRPIVQAMAAIQESKPGAELQTLSLTEAFALTPPDPKAGPRVRVLKDAHVAIEGKSYLVRAGETFAFAARTGRDVTIAARDLLVALPGDAVEIIDDKIASAAKPAAAPETSAKAPRTADEPAAVPGETPAQSTARALRETVQRYPALGVKGSLENQMFLSMVNELRENGGEEFFKNPEWPTELAELLAKREHWQRGAPPATVGPIDTPMAEEPLVPAAR
ncbi:MAG TPA: hypothetical protein VEO95_09010 [Chthoniobacteraceae bacterium]|nr:hypothetical protein [Chthoniobacteraceae bacterium]